MIEPYKKKLAGRWYQGTSSFANRQHLSKSGIAALISNRDFSGKKKSMISF
jgi:hypothetical protein